MKIRTIEDPVYNAQIVVFSNASAHDIDKWGQKKLGINLFPTEWECMAGGVLSVNSKDRGTIYLVWFREAEPSLKTVCHEAFHLCCQILHDRLCDYDPTNQEPYAYYVDFLFGAIALSLPKNLAIE